MWEYDPSENRFGTTMSLMLLPYWTNGCIDSMEGLLFESSTTTPFHFINQNELSVNPSDAVNSTAFQYMGLNVPLGIATSSCWASGTSWPRRPPSRPPRPPIRT